MWIVDGVSTSPNPNPSGGNQHSDRIHTVFYFIPFYFTNIYVATTMRRPTRTARLTIFYIAICNRCVYNKEEKNKPMKAYTHRYMVHPSEENHHFSHAEQHIHKAFLFFSYFSFSLFYFYIFFFLFVSLFFVRCSNRNGEGRWKGGATKTMGGGWFELFAFWHAMV